MRPEPARSSCGAKWNSEGKNLEKTNVVITEIPYTMIGANIAKFLSDVAALSETKKTQDIVDISNQSSKGRHPYRHRTS